MGTPSSLLSPSLSSGGRHSLASLPPQPPFWMPADGRTLSRWPPKVPRAPKPAVRSSLLHLQRFLPAPRLHQEEAELTGTRHFPCHTPTELRLRAQVHCSLPGSPCNGRCPGTQMPSEYGREGSRVQNAAVHVGVMAESVLC